MEWQFGTFLGLATRLDFLLARLGSQQIFICRLVMGPGYKIRIFKARFFGLRKLINNFHYYANYNDNN